MYPLLVIAWLTGAVWVWSCLEQLDDWPVVPRPVKVLFPVLWPLAALALVAIILWPGGKK